MEEAIVRNDRDEKRQFLTALHSHLTEVSVTNDIRSRGSLQPLLQNIGDTLRFFHQAGDQNGRQDR